MCTHDKCLQMIREKGGPAVKLSQSNWVGRALAHLPPLSAQVNTFCFICQAHHHHHHHHHNRHHQHPSKQSTTNIQHQLPQPLSITIIHGFLLSTPTHLHPPGRLRKRPLQLQQQGGDQRDLGRAGAEEAGHTAEELEREEEGHTQSTRPSGQSSHCRYLTWSNVTIK